MTAEAANFNKAVDLDVYLAPAFQLRNNINLELGTVTTTVVVTGFSFDYRGGKRGSSL